MSRMIDVDFASQALNQRLRKNILSYRTWSERLSQETYAQLIDKYQNEIVEIKAKVEEDMYLLQILGFYGLVKESCIEFNYPVPTREAELLRSANAHTRT